jgi:hypothetical protein
MAIINTSIAMRKDENFFFFLKYRTLFYVIIFSTLDIYGGCFFSR